MRPAAFMIFVLLALGGCGTSTLMRAADQGDAAALREGVGRQLAAGPIDLGDAKQVARRMMARQIEISQGPAGRRAIEALDRCMPLFDAALAHRAARDDELGAAAAVARFEAGLEGPMAYAGWLGRPGAHWRAAAIRSFTLREPPPGGDGNLRHAAHQRRRATLDPARIVRLAAIRAAVDAADPGDLPAVIEAARLDPDPAARQAAIEAVGAIGNRPAVVGLQDLWTAASEAERVASVGAWAAAARRREGGPGCTGEADHSAPCLAWRQLGRVAESDMALPGLMAALEVVHDLAVLGGESARAAGAMTSSTRARAESAVAVVERFVDEGPARLRIEAIESAPLGLAHLFEAVVDASKAEDQDVGVAALSRLLDVGGKDRQRAIERLRKIAPDELPVAARARLALAHAGDRSVLPLIARDARASSRTERSQAADSYAALGEVGKTLELVGDVDGVVRSHAACALLQMED